MSRLCTCQSVAGECAQDSPADSQVEAPSCPASDLRLIAIAPVAVPLQPQAMADAECKVSRMQAAHLAILNATRKRPAAAPAAAPDEGEPDEEEGAEDAPTDDAAMSSAAAPRKRPAAATKAAAPRKRPAKPDAAEPEEAAPEEAAPEEAAPEEAAPEEAKPDEAEPEDAEPAEAASEAVSPGVAALFTDGRALMNAAIRLAGDDTHQRGRHPPVPQMPLADADNQRVATVHYKGGRINTSTRDQAFRVFLAPRARRETKVPWERFSGMEAAWIVACCVLDTAGGMTSSSSSSSSSISTRISTNT